MSPLSNQAEAQKTLPRLLKVTQLVHSRSPCSNSSARLQSMFSCVTLDKDVVTWLTKEERASECPVDSHSGKSRICCVYID